MTTDPHRPAPRPPLLRLASSLLLTLPLLSGCAAWSSSSDLARVRDLANSPVAFDLPQGDADEPDNLVTNQDVELLLQEPLDVDTAVQVALLNNRTLRAELRELGIERGQLIQARVLPNPVFEFEALPERQSAYELRVEYDLTDVILAPLRAKAAAAHLDAARYDAAASVIELGYQVRQAFYAVQAAQQRLAIAQRSLDALAAGRDAADALRESGGMRELDAATRVTAYERGRIAVSQLELELTERRERLTRLLGLHGDEIEWTVSAALAPVPEAPPDVDEIETRAVDTSLELAATRSKLEALARETGVSRTEGWLPEIAVDVHALAAPPEGASPTTPMDNRWRFGGGVSLEVPLANRNQGTTRAKEAEFDGMTERYVGLAIDVRSAARNARNLVLTTHGQARHFADVVMPAQQKVVDETLLQYNAMQIGVFELLATKRDQLDLQLAEIDAIESYWAAVAAYEALIAGARVDMDGGQTRTTLGADSSSRESGGH